MRYAQLGLMAVLLACAAAAYGQEKQAGALLDQRSRRFWQSYGVPEDRLFFPRHWIRGFTEFEGAAPTNEPDLGRCAQVWASQFGGVKDPCAAYARYMIGGYFEVQPVGRTVLRHIFIFYAPKISFGHNVPQFSYTASFEPIAYERSIGLGLELPRHFELRLTQHQVDWLGPYRRTMGAADLHTTGPYGLYATIGLRWYFGGYGRLTEGAQ